MLKYISSDLDFINHLTFGLSSLDPSQKSRLSDPSFKSAIHKLKKLRLDLITDILTPLYSSTGRPAIDPAILFRSFILMAHFNFSSIKLWCSTIRFDPLYQFLLGTHNVPSVSSHYDFINRLSHDHPISSELFPDKLYSSNIGKIKRGEKWVNFTDEDVSSLCDRYSIDPLWDRDRFSYTLQEIFNAIAVIPSSDLGLIDPKNLILSGDGTALHIHASPFGHKVDDPSDNLHTHRYSAPEADIGWDSDLQSSYLGFTLYNISYHNPKLNIDLSCFLSIEKASRHDALTTISASAQFLAMNPNLHPRYMCFDSASDNYATHEFLRKHNIIPIIDINHRRKDKDPFASFKDLDENGVPVCMNDISMVYNGYEEKKHRSKYRCPLAMGRIKSCPYKQECCPDSDYGKIRYIKDAMI